MQLQNKMGVELRVLMIFY